MVSGSNGSRDKGFKGLGFPTLESRGWAQGLSCSEAFRLQLLMSKTVPHSTYHNPWKSRLRQN